MAIITRLSRLFRADLHAVIDHLEEPELLLRQAIREMEEEMDKGNQVTTQMESELERLEKQRLNTQEQLEHLNAEVALCFKSGNDTLAKNFIRRKLEAQAILKSTGDSAAELNGLILAKRKQLSEQHAVYKKMKLESDRLTQANASCRNTLSGFDLSAYQAQTVLEEDVELEFLRQQQQHKTNTVAQP